MRSRNNPIRRIRAVTQRPPPDDDDEVPSPMVSEVENDDDLMNDHDVNDHHRTTTSNQLQQTIKRRSNIPSLVAAFSASLTTGGTTYAFGLYGAELKRALHLTQAQVDTISTAFFFAGLFSWIPGLCADRFGSRCSISAGGILGATALLSYWAVARQFVELQHSWLVPTLSVLGIVVFLSSALVTGSVFKIIVTCCGPGTKGSAVGAAKGYVGVGSGVYACLFESIRTAGESNLDFLPMAAFFALVCATCPALILLPAKHQVDHEFVVDDQATPRHFRTLFGSLLLMAALVIGNSMMELMDSGGGSSTNDDDDAFPSEHNATLSFTIRTEIEGASAGAQRRLTMGFMLLAVWWIPIMSLLCLPRESRRESLGVTVQTTTQDGTAGDQSATGRATSAEEATDDGQEAEHLLNHSAETAPLPDEENRNLIQMLQTPSALLMLWTTTILVGAGTVETNNMGQMVEALAFPDQVTPASMAVFSVAQAAGRVATGAMSESALNWNTRRCCIDNGVPRPFFLVVASAVGFVAHFILSIAQDKISFVIGVALSGWAFGMVWPLMVLIVGEVFGTANAGANYMFYDGFTSAIGTLLLTKVLTQSVYEAHITNQDETVCIGFGCFHMTHLVISQLSLTCVITSFAMQYVSRRVYNKPSLHRTQ